MTQTARFPNLEFADEPRNPEFEAYIDRIVDEMPPISLDIADFARSLDHALRTVAERLAAARTYVAENASHAGTVVPLRRKFHH